MTINSSRYSVNIAHGCDAIEPLALFVAAVVAFPVAFRTKVPGLLIGGGCWPSSISSASFRCFTSASTGGRVLS